MFDEICLRIELGCKILAGQLVVGQFGSEQVSSLVAISKTLDKVIRLCIFNQLCNLFMSRQLIIMFNSPSLKPPYFIACGP